jgi:MoaA/NifB/PqqE/SkfB family radical SAM enzyme
MCNIWQKPARPELGPEDFCSLLDDPIFSRIEALTLTGGEPSLSPHLAPLSELFIRKMPSLKSLTLVTNGQAVERIVSYCRTILELCAELQIRFNVSVSLDGVGPLHDEIRNSPGAFLRVKQCLEELKPLQVQSRFWLGAGCVITRQNLYHLDELETWCARQGVELGYQLAGFHETYVANLHSRGEVDITKSDLEFFCRILRQLASDRSISKTMSYYWHRMERMYHDGQPRNLICPFTIDSFCLDAHGDVYSCLSAPSIGNCFASGRKSGKLSRPVSVVYFSPESQLFRRSLRRSACPSCNSACLVQTGLKKDLKRWAWYQLTKR